MIIILSVTCGFRVGPRGSFIDRRNLESASCGDATKLSVFSQMHIFSHFWKIMIIPLVRELLKRPSISDTLCSLRNWSELWQGGKEWLHLPGICLKGQLGQHEFAGVFHPSYHQAVSVTPATLLGNIWYLLLGFLKLSPLPTFSCSQLSCEIPSDTL